MSEECDFHACDQPICDAQKEITGTGFRFCEGHNNEFGGYVRNGKIGAMLGFWVRAEGGAERLAASMMGEEEKT